MAKFTALFVIYANLLILPTAIARNRHAISANRFELLSGVRKSKDTKALWDQKYSHGTYVFGKTPAKFLAENYSYIPSGSLVLDMGMGEGRNAVFLAQKGYKVTGIDISSVAVRKARMLAREFGVRINTVVASLMEYKIAKESLDAIICFYFVERSLNKKIQEWLRPGGILIYESHTDLQRQVKGSEHYNKQYLLRPGELLHMFPSLQVLKYEEPVHLKEFTTSIILRKSLK